MYTVQSPNGKQSHDPARSLPGQCSARPQTNVTIKLSFSLKSFKYNFYFIWEIAYTQANTALSQSAHLLIAFYWHWEYYNESASVWLTSWKALYKYLYTSIQYYGVPEWNKRNLSPFPTDYRIWCCLCLQKTLRMTRRTRDCESITETDRIYRLLSPFESV